MKKLLITFTFLFFTINLFCQVIISEIFAGGGNSGAPYQNDYVVLFNSGSSSVALSGWSIQYAASTSATWNVVALSSSIPAQGYFLIQLGNAGGTPAGAPLTAPDWVSGTPNMNVTGGKIALTNTTTALTSATGNATAPSVKDYIGWGTATDFEGTAAPAPSTNTKAICRMGGDTNNNGADFMLQTPQPRNSAVVLAVVLHSFMGQNKNDVNQLTWQTNSEKDKLDFTIEYATDGKNFHEIGKIQGKSTTNTVQNYTFEHAVTAFTTSYYRLRQVDMEDKMTFSKIISIQSNIKNTLKAYPTLATDKLTISMNNDESVQTFYIFNLSGIVMQTGVFSGQYALTVNDLSKGTYILKVGKEVVKFIKI